MSAPLVPGRRRPGLWLPLGLLGAWLGAWEWSVRAGVVPALFFPAPTSIGAALLRLAASGELATDLGATLSRVAGGFGLGALGGLVLGLAMGRWRMLRLALDPFVAAAHPVPKIALLPLIMLVVGIGEASLVGVVVVAAFFPMLISAMDAVRQIRPTHFEVARTYGAGPVTVLARVVVPGSLPMVLTGARLALNLALLVGVAVELVAARTGLGAMIWLAWQTLRTEELYAGIAVIAALGASVNALLQALGRLLVPWQAEGDA